MTSINDLEMQIEGAEDALAFAKGELADLKTRLRELKEQDKQPEQESLFGRWATHPEYGRGIVISDHEDTDHEVEFAFIEEDTSTGAVALYVLTSVLDLDPVTLKGEQDFEAAPDYTIAEELEYEQTVFMKHGASWFPIGDDTAIDPGNMAPCRVIRWGNGQ